MTDKSKKSKVFVNCSKAFLIGGAICTVGQVLITVYQLAGMGEEDARTLTSVSLIFLGVLVTAFGLYDDLAKHAGAGSLVPITGFANSVVSPAMEFKSEGLIMGTGANIFKTDTNRPLTLRTVLGLDVAERMLNSACAMSCVILLIFIGISFCIWVLRIAL